MKRWALVVLICIGCTRSHDLDGDGGENDAAVTSAVESTVRCGWNACAPGEICCSAACGICSLPGACFGDSCIAVHRIACGSTICDPGVELCCPTCEEDRCAPAGVVARSECPPVSCP